jgi:hypothetical protein
MSDLSDDDRRKVEAQVIFFLDLLSRRYEVSPQEVIDAVRWVRERKLVAEKIRSTGTLSLIGLLVSALALAMWEGVKAMITRNIP